MGWGKLWPWERKPVTAPAHIDSFTVASELKKLGGGAMKVRIVATGEIVNCPRDPMVELMIKAGTVEPVLETPAPKATQRAEWVPPKTPALWSVQIENHTGHAVICWACSRCNQGGRFVGVRTTAEAVAKLRAWHCGHEGGEPVTAPVAARYIALNKQAVPVFVEPKQPAPEVALDENLQPVEIMRLVPAGTELAGVTTDALAEAQVAYEASLKAEQEKQAALNKV